MVFGDNVVCIATSTSINLLPLHTVRVRDSLSTFFLYPVAIQYWKSADVSTERYGGALVDGGDVNGMEWKDSK